jgi:hypothetical protein
MLTKRKENGQLRGHPGVLRGDQCGYPQRLGDGARPDAPGVDGRLRDHTAPEHLAGSRRYDDWNLGYRMGKLYKTSTLGRRMSFTGNAPGRTVSVWRKGWSASVGEVFAQMSKKGCCGTVVVSYYDEGELRRTKNAMI